MVGPAPPDASSPARRLRVLLNPEAGAKGGLPTNAATEATVRTAMAHHGLGDELRVTVSEADAVAACPDRAGDRLLPTTDLGPPLARVTARVPRTSNPDDPTPGRTG